MTSIFSKIIAGDIPCYKIAEDENCFAFLDINPLKQGHTLVVPKQETDQFFDVEDDILCALTLFSKKLAVAIKKAYPCDRISMQVIGLEVPHAHIHLIPITTINDCNFSSPKLKFSREEFEATAKRIQSFL